MMANNVPLGAYEDCAAGEADQGDGGGVGDAKRPPAEGDGAAGQRAERAGRERLVPNIFWIHLATLYISHNRTVQCC